MYVQRSVKTRAISSTQWLVESKWRCRLPYTDNNIAACKVPGRNAAPRPPPTLSPGFRVISLLYVSYTQIAHGHLVCDINACYCLRGVSHRRAAELLRTNQALVCSFVLCTCIARQYPIPFRWVLFP